MLEPLSNKQRKKEFGKAIEAERARIQASIDACNARRATNRENREKLAEAQEELRLRQLANLKKKMVIIYAVINGQIVILTIVDPSLMKSTYSERNTILHMVLLSTKK
jgi:predicted methyltransferase